jgi:hypothetical protein
MVTHGNKQIKEQSSTLLHLHLHGPTPLEGVFAADDQSEIVGTQLGIRIGCLGVSVAGRREYGADLDAGLEALLAKGEPAQLRQLVAQGCAATVAVSTFWINDWVRRSAGEPERPGS